MNSYLKTLISKYRNRGILVDSNLLILYFVGQFSTGHIPKFGRTKKFLIEDYYTVKAFIDGFPTRVTTPNILTEVSNLSRDMPGHMRLQFMESLAIQFDLLEEHSISSKIGSSVPIFKKLGLTDAIIGQLAKDTYLVLTDDFPLTNYLKSIGVDAINFNHLRFLG